MRIPNPRLARLAGLTRGAQTEPGDGVLLVPAVLQPSIELPSPQIIRGNVQFDDSGIAAAAFASTGPLAAASTVICILPKGLWRIHWTFQANFVGTTAIGNQTELDIQMPGPVVVPLVRMQHQSGRQLTDNGSFIIALEQDGWQFLLAAGLLVAADSLSANACIIANRLT
jgi:hypothetical protein